MARGAARPSPGSLTWSIPSIADRDDHLSTAIGQNPRNYYEFPIIAIFFVNGNVKSDRESEREREQEREREWPLSASVHIRILFEHFKQNLYYVKIYFTQSCEFY